jgi:hypothetical protein
MNFNDVDIDLLEYVFVSDKIKDIKYNNKKRLELWTPVVYINKTKDSYSNEYIQFDLEEYPRFLELIKIIDMHAMINHDINEDNKENFKSSIFENKLSCKIPKKKNIVQTRITINKYPSVVNDIKNRDKASCCIYLDQIYIDNNISLKWKIKQCCVYRNDK